MDELAFSSRLTTQEKLLLSQAVYKLGALQWPNISKLLLSHPCCRDRPAELFTPQGCEESYVGLMTAIGVNVPAEGATKPLASVHLRLAQTFYLARLSELQTQIATYESQFTSLMSEISAIRSGSLDEAIRNEVRAVLARKYGKRLLDSWVPPVEDVRGAVGAGPVSEEEVKEEEERVRAGMAEKDRETDQEKEKVDEKVEKEIGTETVTTISEVVGEKHTEKVVDEGITEPAGEDVEMEESPKSPKSPKQAGEEPEEPSAITTEPPVSLPSEEKEFAKAPTASPTKSSRSELSPAPGSPLSDAPDQADENEVESPQRGEKAEEPESSAKSPVAEEPEAEVEERELAAESEPEPEPETATTRSRKRKASVPPKAPPAKRAGRRAASPVDTAPDNEAASEPEAEAMEVEEEGEGEGEGEGEEEGNEEPEVEADQEVEVEAEAEAEEEEEAPTTRGRRASKRHVPTKVPTTGTSKKSSAAAAAPESPSARTKDSSPAISRRAPSVSSTTSATPATAEERRSSRLGRGRHSDAASVVAAVKHREQSAAVESVKEEEGEQEDGEEKRPTRTSGRRKGAAEAEVSTPAPASDKRSKRGSIRTSVARESVGDDDEVGLGARGGGGAEGASTVTSKKERSTPVPDRERDREHHQAPGSASSSAALSGRVGKSNKNSTSAGVSASASTTPRDAKSAQKLLFSLHDAISGHRNGNVFQGPVRKSDAKDYYDVIKRPMDLKTIRGRIRDGLVTTIDEFERDVLLMFANAMMYNAKGSQVYDMAEEMLRESENHIAHFRTLQHDVGR